MMTPGGETTLEEEIIYNPDIEKLIEAAERRIMVQLDRDPDPPYEIRSALETLVFKAIREWTGE